MPTMIFDSNRGRVAAIDGMNSCPEYFRVLGPRFTSFLYFVRVRSPFLRFANPG